MKIPKEPPNPFHIFHAQVALSGRQKAGNHHADADGLTMVEVCLYFQGMAKGMPEVELPPLSLFLFVSVDNVSLQDHRVIDQSFGHIRVKGHCLFMVFLQIGE